jgi:hypothetical protein
MNTSKRIPPAPMLAVVAGIFAVIGFVGWWTVQVVLVWPFAVGRWVKHDLLPVERSGE